MAALLTFSIGDSASMTRRNGKPAPEAYAEVNQALGASAVGNVHGRLPHWDTIGAQAVGWEAGLIQRANNDVLDTAAQPQYVGKYLDIIADLIIARKWFCARVRNRMAPRTLPRCGQPSWSR